MGLGPRTTFKFINSIPWNNFPRIVGMLNYILCSELMQHFGEIFDVTLGVTNATKGSFFFCGGWRDPCKLSAVQFAWQFMKSNSFICLTYQLSDNLKIRYTFSPMTYTNYKFWFHLCYILVPMRSSNQNYVLCFS